MSIPLNSNSQLKTLYLNSQLATKTNNIYNFEFATPIIVPLNQQAIISVAEFSVPYVFPLFNSSNNVIATSESGTPYTLIIPDTIRNPIDFAAYWNGNKPAGYTATLVYNKQTFKFTFFFNVSYEYHNRHNLWSHYRFRVHKQCRSIIYRFNY